LSGIIDSVDQYLFEGEFILIGEDGANLVSRSTPIAFLASGKFWVNNHAHVLRARTKTTNEWVCWFTNMIDLTPFVTGSAQPKLTQANLNRICVPLPPLDEQHEIVYRIGTTFGWIDRILSDATHAAALLDRLDQAVLSKAFAGELIAPREAEAA
jgi:type I restriction enzyme, S subunit